MNFYEAIALMQQGKTCISSEGLQYRIRDNQLSWDYRNKNLWQRSTTILRTLEDLDWELCVVPTFDFFQAMQHLLEGKKVGNMDWSSSAYMKIAPNGRNRVKRYDVGWGATPLELTRELMSKTNFYIYEGGS